MGGNVRKYTRIIASKIKPKNVIKRKLLSQIMVVKGRKSVHPESKKRLRTSKYDC